MTDLAKLDIKYLPGVGPKRADLLNKELEIHTYLDLLHYYPYKYIDRSKTYKISEIDGSMPYIQLRGRIVSYNTHGEGARRRLTALFSDGTGVIELVWFKGIRYITERYKPGTEYTLFGRPTLFNGKFNIAHPELDPIDDRIDNTTGLQGYYNTTEKMKNAFLNSKALQKMVYTLLTSIQAPLPETLPAPVIAHMQLMGITDALRNIHFPISVGHLRRAEMRLKFEELFYLQLHILRYTRLRNQKLGGFRFDHIGDCFNNFYHHILPFELTQAQKRVIKEIRADMGSGRQMNRLLQGDVGSGKTLVALMSMLIAVDNGYQACLMAPTEILATQHYEGLRTMVEPLGVRIELLTGSVTKKRRAPILEGLLTGEVNLLIGTHALLEDTVHFANLGFVVIDEQHRFGVEQRSRLWHKNTTPPHILVMTATPIPRTLAMTVYGDLDVSVIDQLPPGRKPIQTLLQYDSKRGQLYAALRKQLQIGRQAYIVYPLIQESEKSDLKNLEEGYDHIREVFPEYRVCMVHGKMKAAEKEEQMQRFVSGEAQIMVATTVIEVGVNVPNASVMIIENAERFGLAQLHQLRGRVGRGAEQSYCILMTSYKINQDTRKRLELMTETNDGFRIAEADMQMRGPGDMEGTQQSGIAFNLQIANLAKDGQILQAARDEANALLDSDERLEHPENYIVRKELSRIFERQKNWGLIS
ncbi:ATP-dependent DNA helicase RecG [Barnesiella sp. An22]|uniref:ATP-dependent DNA helicase RecG n=1 Tax=Barnesiella sp. An22 TaxID=1965590 RepID=UPI000B378ECF|nr:ATP-dependent DNA helicase RecG [Barnesiella sp. An22]OUO97808.1 ATP-dependent DNA helicase RecG [Barnesiella sp. An22]HJB71856.1 ATP-dependent DNA helicase RecG [Candidatus Barnesiella merdigallinarum]